MAHPALFGPTSPTTSPLPIPLDWRRAATASTLAAAQPSSTANQPGLTVDGTEFVLTTADGRILRSPDLVGATLKIGGAGGVTNLTIQSVEEDRDAKGGQVMLHHFVVQSEGGAAADLCAADATGRSLGFPIPDGRGGFDLICTSGAVGKCIRWGYRPWEERPGGPSLRALHQACTRMVRADYGGDGQATTRDGMMIDLYDRFGIQTLALQLHLSCGSESMGDHDWEVMGWWVH